MMNTALTEKAPLTKALHDNNMHEFLELLKTRKGDPNEMDELGENPILCTAIKTGNLEAIKLLIAYGAKINQPNKGFTPLSFAISSLANVDDAHKAKFSLNIIEILLTHGAHLNITSEHAPFMMLMNVPCCDIEFAILRLELTQKFLNHGMDVNYIYSNQYTPLSLALEQNNVPILFALLASLAPQQRQEIFSNLKKQVEKETKYSSNTKGFFSAKDSLPMLDIFSVLTVLRQNYHDTQRLAKCCFMLNVTPQEITHIINDILPSQLVKEFDKTFKEAYQTAIRIRSVNHFSRENGFLQIQLSLPEENTFLNPSQVKSLLLPDDISKQVTYFAINLPLNINIIFSKFLKEHLATPLEERNLNASKNIFFQKLADIALENLCQLIKGKKEAMVKKQAELVSPINEKRETLKTKPIEKSSFSSESFREGPSR